MSVAARAQIGVKQAVPFFWVTDIERSICFYSDGLGFEVKNKWIDNGKLRWCWLQYGGAALMLQEFLAEKVPTERRGVGVSVCFQCNDALAFYRDVRSRGIAASKPFVGNAMWVTCLTDPDGYKIDFESPTDAPEEAEYADI